MLQIAQQYEQEDKLRAEVIEWKNILENYGELNFYLVILF
jgi:hypothetical protein